jgi:hypothetical protein
MTDETARPVVIVLLVVTYLIIGYVLLGMEALVGLFVPDNAHAIAGREGSIVFISFLACLPLMASLAICMLRPWIRTTGLLVSHAVAMTVLTAVLFAFAGSCLLLSLSPLPAAMVAAAWLAKRDPETAKAAADRQDSTAIEEMILAATEGPEKKKSNDPTTDKDAVG